MQKTSFSLLALLALLLGTVGAEHASAAWDGTSKTRPSTETIGGKTFFLIETEANLAWFRDSVNESTGNVSANAKLMNSLDMGGKLFVPIAVGSDARRFTGIFDGNGKTISNLYLNSEELGEIPSETCSAKYPKCNAQNVGFIGVLGGNGVVKNLNLENVDILASTSKGESGSENNPVSVGPIVAFQKENSTVDNCLVTGNILTSGKGNGIGGLVGNSWSGQITNSLSSVNVRVSGDDSYVGGVIGLKRSTGSVTIEACAYDGSIIINSGNGSAGGVIGYFEVGELSVSRSYFDTDINLEGLGTLGEGMTLEGQISSAKNLNTGKVVCDLNGGQWTNNACSKSGSWSMGSAHITLNGVATDANGNVVYEVLFDANGGEFASDAKFVKFLKAGDLITADEISMPVHGDTVFGGWALTPDATGPAESFGTVKGPQTVFAYWKTMHQITFDATSRGAFDDKDSPQTQQKLVAEGEPIDVEGIGIPQYTNDGTVYFFAGWAASQDATEALENLGTASGPATFFAFWVESPTYVVTFDTHGYGAMVAYVQENEQNNQTVARPDDPFAEGYDFGGWFTAEEGGEEFDFSSVINENKVLHAKWSLVNFPITYELDGGTNSTYNPDTYNIKSADIKLRFPTKTGFNFDGWYYDNEFTNMATQISKGSSGAKKFYAKWKKKTYTITYMAGSYGAEVIPAETKEYGQSIKLKGAVYTSQGNIQKGWATENGGKKVYELGAEYKLDKDLTLYPYWEKDPASIRYGTAGRLSTFSVVVQGRTLDISSVKAGEKWAVYDMRGSLVAQGITRNASSRVQIQQPGNYLVRMGGQFRTVRIR